MSLHTSKALPQTWDYSLENDLGLEAPGNASIECEQPNNSLYTFTGNLQLGRQKISLSTNQVDCLLICQLCRWLLCSDSIP
jgi:phospholipid-transporting ATPase